MVDLTTPGSRQHDVLRRMNSLSKLDLIIAVLDRKLQIPVPGMG